MSKEVTFQDAYDELWNLQHQLENEHLDTPETTQAVVTLDKLLHEAEAKYKAKQPTHPKAQSLDGGQE